jgi:hypothetical protein
LRPPQSGVSGAPSHACIIDTTLIISLIELCDLNDLDQTKGLDRRETRYTAAPVWQQFFQPTRS